LHGVARCNTVSTAARVDVPECAMVGSFCPNAIARHIAAPFGTFRHICAGAGVPDGTSTSHSGTFGCMGPFGWMAGASCSLCPVLRGEGGCHSSSSRTSSTRARAEGAPSISSAALRLCRDGCAARRTVVHVFRGNPRIENVRRADFHLWARCAFVVIHAQRAIYAPSGGTETTRDRTAQREPRFPGHPRTGETTGGKSR
jgi:hypothetical protein